MISGPYLSLHCEKVPDPDDRPFTVAGCVAVWLSEDEPYPSELDLGDLGGSDDEVELPEYILEDLRVYRLPKPETLLGVSQYFPSATHITFLNTGLIVELPETSVGDYIQATEVLPRNLAHTGITLGYHNGMLAPTEMMRLQAPKSETIEGECGDTDYVQNEGEAKTFLRSREISFNDDFMIDDYPTGRQMLKILGRRMRIAGKEKDPLVPEGKANTSPSTGPFIASIQGIYATSTLLTNSEPAIREGVCGSAILRSSVRGKGNVVVQGGIAGFMQYSDLRPEPPGEKKLLCFVEALDDMIDDGWEVVRISGKRKVEDDGEGRG